jgi:hypothetical protein
MAINIEAIQGSGFKKLFKSTFHENDDRLMVAHPQAFDNYTPCFQSRYSMYRDLRVLQAPRLRTDNPVMPINIEAIQGSGFKKLFKSTFHENDDRLMVAHPPVSRMSNTNIQRMRTQMIGNTIVILLYGGRPVYADVCRFVCKHVFMSVYSEFSERRLIGCARSF